MKDNIYRDIVAQSSVGYTYNKIICDDLGLPCDYEFIEVNDAFETITGLNALDLIGKRLTEILPEINNSELDIIKLYGEISLNGERKEKEIFSTFLNRWFSISIYSQEKDYFITQFSDITQRKKAEDLLHQTHQNYESFFNSIDEFLFVLDEDGNIIHVNSTVINRLGYTITELCGKSILMVHPPERRNEAGRIVGEMLMGISEFCPVPIITKKGNQIPVETRITRGFWDGKPAIFGVTKDISRIALSEEKFSKLFHLNPSACGLSDLITHEYIEVNEAFFYLFGFNENEVIGKTATDLGILTPNAREIVLQNADINGNVNAVEADLKAKNGNIKHVLLSSENIYVQDMEYRFTVVNDITEIKEKQEQIEYLSYCDQLTGLFNRRYYDQEIDRLDNEIYYPLTLIMADINGLKLTNDAFGHHAGDLLLQKVADILKLECRENDIIARIGGDEFVILLPKTDVIEAQKVIDRINTATTRDKINNINISISTGYAVKRDNSEYVNDILQKAEDDMYRHKLTESAILRSKTIDLIMKTLYEKYEREMHHSKQVGEICEAIAKQMNLSTEEISQIKTAGLMHDIGKIGICEATLNSIKSFSDYELIDIKRHSEIGYRILSSSIEYSEIANFILAHHEKWDGSGYPKQLKGEEIPLQARIIAVADAYNAMTSYRSYGNALSSEVAVAELKRCSGTQFAPDVAKIFVEKVLKKVW